MGNESSYEVRRSEGDYDRYPPPPRDSGRVVRESDSRYSASPFQHPILDVPEEFKLEVKRDTKQKIKTMTHEPSEKSTKASRANFVKRVYLILSAMLLVDAVFIVLALFVHELRAFLQHDWNGLIIYLAAFVVFLCVYITLACCWYPRHASPLNWILLCIMCLSMGVMLAALAAFHSVEEILYAAVGTLLVVLCVSLVAMCGTIDITGCGMYLCIAGLVCVLGALIATTVCLLGLCGSTARIVGLVISIVFVLLFSMYLLYDTQLVLGGGRVQLAEDEYLLGAIHLWVDIVQIFMCMLGISSY